MGGIGAGTAPNSGAIVVAESRLQLGILFGFLNLVFAVALARGATSAQTATGRVAAAVIFGIVILGCAARWIVMARQQPARLEVTPDAIRYVARNGQESVFSRQQGDELRFIRRHRGALSRIWTLELAIAGTDDTMAVSGLFSRKAVRQACRSAGWRFDDKISRIW